jgi:esterase
MILFHRQIGEHGKPLVILHGLFGSGDNLQTHAKNWSTHFQVFIIDNRNHGHSPHDEEMTYDLMALDLKETLDKLNLTSIYLLGHSMGGKMAMRFAQLFPEIVEKLIVVDMGVKAYPPHHQIIFEGLEAVNVSDCPSRKEAESRLARFVSEISTQQFLLKNLYWKTETTLAWRFHLDALKTNISHILSALPLVTCSVECLFLHGGKSNYVLVTDEEQIKELFTHAQIACIENAGHWVHVEAPTLFSQSVLNFLHNP